MEGDPVYRVEVLDRILRDWGCALFRPPGASWAYAWARRAHEDLLIAAFSPQGGTNRIRESHVAAIASQLRLDPAELVRRIKDGGGEFLGP